VAAASSQIKLAHAISGCDFAGMRYRNDTIQLDFILEFSSGHLSSVVQPVKLSRQKTNGCAKI
jgi:hypothetical protein